MCHLHVLVEYKTGNDIIDSLVFETRKKLCSQPIEIGQKYSTEQECGVASMFLQEKLNKSENISGMVFTTSYSFGIPNNAHAFNFVVVDGKNYIIDCTFSQFTKLYRMNLGIIKLPREIINAEPSYFLMQTDEGKILLDKLLTCGYFEITPENLKLYLDSFLLSNRNGYYYLNNDTSIFETGISEDYYINELNSMLKSGIERRYNVYPDEKIPDIFGLENISYTDLDFSKEEIAKINKKILK